MDNLTQQAIDLLNTAAELRLSNSDWVLFHKIKNEAGLPLEFDDHSYLRDFIDDMSPLQVMLKAPQIGATVAELIKTFRCAHKEGWDIIYTLPTQSDVQDMAGGKINRIIAQNPILKSWTKDHDTVDQKAVGKSIIYYRGTFTTKEAMMVSSDLNVHDEVDASNPEVIQQYETRLQAKANGRRWYFSHPLLGGMGVDRYWQLSDKKEWFIRCPECLKEQQLKWPDNVNVQKRSYVCSACGKDLDNLSRKHGKWSPTSTGIFSGYHISQLMCPWITAEKILQDWETKDKQYFYNYVLGLPYISTDDQITPGAILKNCTDAVNPQEDRTIIGVDTQQKNIYYVCLNKKGIFHYGKTKDVSDTYDPYDQLRLLLKRWPNSFLVADQGGDLMGIRKLQAENPGRVFLSTYVIDNLATKEMIKWGERENFGTVQVQRNRMIGLIVEHFRDFGRLRLNGTKEEWTEYASHYGNIYRELVTATNNPGKDDATLYKSRYIWKHNGPDHWVHATVYALTGLDRYSETLAQFAGQDPWEGIPLQPQGPILL